MESEDENKTGNEHFEGYCIDLIKEIAQILEFKYVIKLVDDGVHGRRNERGEWNGMIKELIEGVRHNPFVSTRITLHLGFCLSSHSESRHCRGRPYNFLRT